MDLISGRDVACYELSGKDFKGKTGAIVASVAREDTGSWLLSAIGSGININTTEDLIGLYA